MTREVKAWWVETAAYFQEERHLDVGVNWTGFGPDIQLLESIQGKEVLELREPGTDEPDDYEARPWGEHTPKLMAEVPVVLVVDARKPGEHPRILSYGRS